MHGGVNLVQLREKDLPASSLLKLATSLREITRGHALFFVNDRVDVALACDADGVQLGEEALPLRVARQLVGEDVLLGRSAHSLEGAVVAESEGADLLVVGTIFDTPSHVDAPPAGRDLLRQVAQAVGAPFIGIGGINIGNIGQVVQAGASGAAVIRAILGASDPEEAASQLRRALNAAWEQCRTVRKGITP